MPSILLHVIVTGNSVAGCSVLGIMSLVESTRLQVARSRSSSYFDLPCKQSQSNDSPEEVSPFSGPSLVHQHGRVRRVRPTLKNSSRSRSDDTFSIRRVHTIEEDDFIPHSQANVTPTVATSKSNAGELGSYLDAAQASSPQLFEESSDQKRFRHIHVSQPDESSSEAGPGDWSRNSKLGSIWTKTRVRSSTTDRQASVGDSATSSRDAQRAADFSEGSPILIQPLRPPSMGTRYSEPISEHRITVEQYFPEDDAHGGEDASAVQSTIRSNPINPRQLFSLSFDIVRRLAKRNDDQIGKATEGGSKFAELQGSTLMDHPTNLRKRETADILIGATSMLQETKGYSTRFRDDKAVRANNFGTEGQIQINDHSKSPVILGRVKSMEINIEDTESQSSSLAELKLGNAPYNTPNEQAKYTIVNQIGELEEFFKVDISVRGQTSYLPSEARRIHTPPLPDEGCKGKRRGFFFDYNLPEKEHATATARVVSRLNDPVREEQIRLDTQRDSASALTSQQPSSSPPPRGKIGRVKVGDWYTAQLAELDSLVTDEPSPRSQRPMTSSAKCTKSYFDATQQQMSDEAQLDYNIPEHYPTSPLCPRHPRYWRVMKNKGSQFRGCWMHGYGEFTEAEKAMYGIVNKVKL